MTYRLGYIGGGQLCRMTGEEILRRGLQVELHALDPTPECSAYPFLKSQLVGDYADPARIRELAERCDVMTYEIEQAGADTLQQLESEGMIVHPSPATLRTIQDKYLQAKFLEEHNLNVPRTLAVSDSLSACEAAEELGFPVMIKARRGSYDGRGNFLANSYEGVKEGEKKFDGKCIMLQKYIDFTREISVIAARNTLGQVETYPIGENYHEGSILRFTIVPARISADVASRAKNLAMNVMNAFGGAGVFGIEMFVANGDVMVNEIAPRVHNSGHYTIEACMTSQFEQDVRAKIGLSLGSTSMIGKCAIMHNILSDGSFEGEYDIRGLDVLRSCNANIHMYGKRDVPSGKPRKMGHFTIVYSDVKSPEKAIDEARKLNALVKFRPKTA